jgi:hypothetical protein
MTSTTCPLCGARKARRACPAVQRDICAVCCGTKRLTEIACPSTCGYLQIARQHPPVAVRRRDQRELMFFASGLRGTSERQRTIFAFLQTAILKHAARAVPQIHDRDVAEAAGALAGTFETAAKGIIYEQQPASLPAQRLASDVRQQIEQTLHASERPLDRDLATALRRTEMLAMQAATQLEGGETAYLEFLNRRLSRHDEPEPENSGPSLIIPG